MTEGAPGGGVESLIAGWRPRTVGPEAAAFARAAVRATAPASRSRAKALLFATAKLAVFGTEVGLECTPEVLLRASVIERFVVAGSGTMSPPTRRTVRTNLRHVARRVLPGGPPPVGLPRERAKTSLHRRRDRRLPRPGRRAANPLPPPACRRARLCGAGAGLTGADLRAVRGIDIVERSGGMVVLVGGRRPRVVPVLARFHEPLAGVAPFVGDGLVVGGLDPSRRNVTTPLISSLSGGADLPRLELGRLRSTWLVSCADTIGLKAFMAAAGVACTERLGDLLAHLPEPAEADTVARLGARR